jgi:GNAT superfamily N-acetyltransferase
MAAAVRYAGNLRRMGELELGTVAAANDAWVGDAPEGSEVIETSEYRIVCLPERFPDRLQVQWVKSPRPAPLVVDEIIAQCSGFGQANAFVYAKVSSPDGLGEALVSRGAELVDTADVLAMAWPADLKVPELPGFEVRWWTTPEVARDANTIGVAVFGGSPAPDDAIARRTEAQATSVAAGAGGGIVAYLDGTPVAIAAVEIADGVARLSAGGVLEEYRGRGLYRALLAARMAYAVEHGATIALTQGRSITSSPILQRLGFVSYGEQHSYRLPLASNA